MAEYSSEAHRIVLDGIERIPGFKRPSGSDINILCPFHFGDTVPSCGINIVPRGKLPLGWYHCFGCGAKGHWNDLAERFGLTTIERRDEKITDASWFAADAKRAGRELLDGTELEMPFGTDFTGDRWRGVSGDTVRGVGAVYSIDTWNQQSEACLYLPVRVDGDLSAIVKAYLAKRPGRLSYVTIGGSDVKTKSLFPYDFVESMLATQHYAKVAIVEGPRDALKLIDYGVPALAILGTNSWSDSKRAWLLGLCSRYGVNPVVIMDADKVDSNKTGVGQLTQRKIVKSLKPRIATDQVKLWEHAERLGVSDLDPASMPRTLKRKLAEVCLA